MWRKIADIAFWLGLSLLLGGLLAIGIVVAPAVFNTARDQQLSMPNIATPPLEMDRQVGGEVFGNILNRFSTLETTALVLLLIGLAPRFFTRRVRTSAWILLALWTTAAGLTALDAAWLRPKVWSLRTDVRFDAATRAALNAPPETPWPNRDQFDQFHHLSETLGKAKVYALLAMLIIAAWRGLADRNRGDKREFLRRAMGEKSHLTR